MFQLFNDGAVVRIENGSKILLLSKEQVRTIDTIKDNIVRIDIGEGPLRNIFVNYQDVQSPVVGSANELRDLIKQWMLSDNYDGSDAKEATQVSILTQLLSMTQVLQAIKAQEVDIAKSEPSRMDESNPYIIYRGWHKAFGVPDAPEWAIERIRREGDEFIHEWAFATKKQNFTWTDRLQHPYFPYDHDLPVQAPLPGSPMPQGPQILVINEPQPYTL